MKTMKLKAVALLLLSFIGTAFAQAEEISRKVEVNSFSSINMNAVGQIYFVQEKECSFRIEGEKNLVEKHSVAVENSTLILRAEGRYKKEHARNGVRIYVSAPDLQSLCFSGVGKFSINERMEVDDVQMRLVGVGTIEVSDMACNSLNVIMEGVGECQVHVNCDNLTAKLQGVGSVKLSGSAGNADIRKSGLGSVDTEDLHIGR